jgi:DNA ligase-1
VIHPISISGALNGQRRDLLRQGALLATALLWSPLRAATGAATVEGAAGYAAHVMLAKPWLPSMDPAGYLVSEKLDGVRALWDGRSLRFRSGRPIAAPDWFLGGLPAVALDGELWLGRRSFDALSGTVRKTIPVDAEWRAVRYMAFDLPEQAGAFALRAQRLTEVVASAHLPWLHALEQSRMDHSAALQAHLQEVVAAGGEGLVLHRADALWTVGRSDALRKLKMEPDEEGRVIAQVPGRGKYTGRMGALLLETPEGRRFSLGTGFTDAQRSNPPAVGSVVTYRYRDHTAKGLPKFASFMRVREAGSE